MGEVSITTSTGTTDTVGGTGDAKAAGRGVGDTVPTTRPLRVLLVAGLGATAATVIAILAALAVSDRLTALASPAVTVTDLLVTLTATALCALSLWLAVAVAVSASAHLPRGIGRTGSRLAAKIAPASLRRTVAVAVGAAIVTAVVTPAAQALPGTSPATHRQNQSIEAGVATSGGAVGLPVSTPAEQLPSPGWTPAPPLRTVTPTEAAAVGLMVPAPRPAPSEATEVVVRRGDTLWDLTARHLGENATAAQIAQEWPRWYQANARTIGPDPDRLVPGQRLRAPAEG